MTKDQKRALLIGGGVALLALILYYTRGSILPPGASGIQDAPAPNGFVPTYTDYNVTPFRDLPTVISNPRSLPPGVAGCGCSSTYDGCAGRSPIDTGAGPVSLAQLLYLYGKTSPDFANLISKSTVAYDVTPVTIMEQTDPVFIRQQTYNDIWDYRARTGELGPVARYAANL